MQQMREAHLLHHPALVHERRRRAARIMLQEGEDTQGGLKRDESISRL